MVRRRRNRRKKVEVVVAKPVSNRVSRVVVENGVPRSRRRRGRKPRSAGSGTGVTPDGMQFLRSVIAPYDFAQEGCAGVPDEYAGPAFVAVQRIVATFMGDAVNDTYIAVMPTPQIAYWTCKTSSLDNNSIFAASMFPQQVAVSSSRVANTVGTASMIRVIGLTAEMKSIGPLLTTAGVVRVRKAEVRLATFNRDVVVPTVPPTNIVESSLMPEGLVTNFAGMTAAPHFESPFRDGFYTSAVHRGPWAFAEPLDIEARAGLAILLPAASVGNSTDGVLSVDTATSVFLNGSLDWFDPAMQTIFIAIPKNVVTNMYTLEVLMTCEIKPNASSFFANLVKPSPLHDPLALDMYERLADVIPHGVPAAKNADFWRTVIALAKLGGFFVGKVPGPVGLLGVGVESIAQGLEALAFPDE